MPNFEEYKCPICNQQFSNNDDIVTCPDCGTPHHRDCYMITGHCVNKGLHSSGYNFMDENKPIIEIAKEESGKIYYNPQDNENNKNINQDDARKFSPIMIDAQSYFRDNVRGKIDGYEASDIAATVRNNSSVYLEKFRKLSVGKSKIGWNWSAFFFGSFYLLFRKMYKQGISLFCLFVAIIYADSFFINKFAPKFVGAFIQLIEKTKEYPTRAEMENLMKISDYQKAKTIMFIMLLVILLIRIIIALFADNIYKKTVFDIIKKTDERLANGETFATPIMLNQMPTVDAKQMRMMYLSSRGGVSVFAPMLAYFVLYVIMTVL